MERAVALTFTLDLDSALIVPLSLAAQDLRASKDPLAVMEAVRRCADKVDIFCQAGQIIVPSQPTDLHAFLEGMVHPVRRPRTGRLFHPKLWALRYKDEGSGFYLSRLLVLSRNLTADRSWDVCLRLDGYVGTSRVASNRPIADLIRHGADLALDLKSDRRQGIDELVEDLRRTVWELPDGVTGMIFHALGTPSQSKPDFSGSRHLVVSPFCTPEGIDLAAPSERSIVVGRQEELDRLPQHVLDGRETYVISELAGLADEYSDTVHEILTGLHAKVYVAEHGLGARLLIGSANATAAAFGGNLELLVELSGGRKLLGVDTMLGADAALREILEPYERQPPIDVDDAEESLQDLVRDLAAIPLALTVWAGGASSYDGTLTSEVPVPDTGRARVTVELLTRRGEAAELAGRDLVAATFRGLEVADVTPFVVVTASLDQGLSASTVVRARLIGDPACRLDDIIARQVDTPEKFLRFLALLLGLGGQDNILMGSGHATGGQWTAGGASGVLELLMRALVDQPGQIDDLARLVDRLTSTERGRELLPEGFIELWQVIEQVRQDQRLERAW